MTLAVFAVVYAGMILGGLPRLKVDRTGVALLGAIALIASGAIAMQEALAMIDLATVTLLFGLMIVSAQLRLGGFYARVSQFVTAIEASPPLYLGALIVTVAVLSAVFSNDIVCLAVPPVVILAARRRGLDPVPFLLGTACAANAGSAATLIGNPQNMLIGEVLDVPFAGYAAVAALPVVLSLGAIWGIVVAQVGGRWHDGRDRNMPGETPAQEREEIPPFDRWQTAKGLAIAGALLVLFLTTTLPRELLAIAAAGLLLTSRKMHSHKMLGLVDWPLLVLFAGLFVTNGALQQTPYPARAVEWLQGAGVSLASVWPVYWVTAILSNIVSNVPAVMLLLPHATATAGPAMAISSTLAGNLTIVGSIANIIVVDIAARHGISIDWRRHAKTGVPVTLVTLVLAWLALALTT
ncbi:MAG TPA: SLC13 family permease [Thermoanaerobaculia bacterium]|nr:SLC13 family permease [Thermoanaerobaculia bacterium]